MSQNNVQTARHDTTRPLNMVTHLVIANSSRSSTRSPSPPSPSTSFGEGSFNSASSTNTTTDTGLIQLSEPRIFTGLTTSNVDFKDWSTKMLAKLNEMTNAKVEEKDKMQYVMEHTGRDAFSKLLDRFEEMKGKGVAFGSAKPMVMYLAQYYDEQIRTTDIRFSTW